MTEIKGVTTFDGGPKKVTMQSVFLKPIAITKDNLRHCHRRRLDQEGNSLPGCEGRIRQACKLRPVVDVSGAATRSGGAAPFRCKGDRQSMAEMTQSNSQRPQG